MTVVEEAPVSLAEAPVRRLNMIEAINDALDIMLGHDPNVVVFGEDVGYFGGVFRATAGLQQKHGKTRVFDTPISEGGIIGAAVGMGAYGLRPVPEIQFADYIYPGLDQLISEAARLRYRSAGEYHAPLTVRAPFGGGIFGGQTHSQSPEALFTHVAGLKTVGPEEAAIRVLELAHRAGGLGVHHKRAVGAIAEKLSRDPVALAGRGAVLQVEVEVRLG